MNKKILLLTVLISVAGSILLTGFASAFGVSSAYWEGNPLTIAPGEETTFDLILQNMVGDSDVTIMTELQGESAIASTPTTTYFVPLGNKDTKVPVYISIPEGVSPGYTETVRVSFKTVNDGGSGGVALGTGVITAFDVLVVSEPTLAPVEGLSTTAKVIIGIILVVLIGLIIYFLRKGNNKKKKK